jgi:hypothetical protein
VKNTPSKAAATRCSFCFPALKKGVVCKVPTYRKQRSEHSQGTCTLEAAVTEAKKAKRAEQESEGLVTCNVSDLTLCTLQVHMGLGNLI